MADNADWHRIEQLLARAAEAQGFYVRKDGNGRYVVYLDGGDGGTLDLEKLAREVAEARHG